VEAEEDSDEGVSEWVKECFDRPIKPDDFYVSEP
jgi:hypothetical protein